MAVLRYALAQLLFLGITASAVSAQTTYYVAANGNDNNNGTSTGSPFQTLAKVNSLTLRAGDQVLFKRGDTFRGGLQVRQSGASGQPIIYDAYDNGAKPVLSGSVPLTNWNSLGNNRWQTTCSSCNGQLTGLYRRNNSLPLSRYPNQNDPNKGYLTIQSHQNTNQITSQQGLSPNFNTGWTGAEVVIRATQWVTDRYGFSGQSGNTLNVTSPNAGYGIQDGWGFFVQNHPSAIDQEGEWAFDINTKTVQLYSATGNPNDQVITATAVGRAVDLSNVSNITIRNLTISQSLNANLYINSSSNLTFSSLDVLNAGQDGVIITGSGQGVVLENSTIQYINNNGVLITPYQNVTFRGNTLRHVGVDAGRSKSGDGQANGLQTSVGQGMLIENNTIDSIGYNAISFVNRTIIQRNVISNFCMTKSDGGGLYNWNGNQENRTDIHVISNIIFNGLGAPEGTPGSTYSGANGIFFDDCAQGAEVANNTIFNCTGLGIFMNATSNMTITGNTSYNNGETQLTLTDDHGHCLPRNNTIQNNILVGRTANQLVVKYHSNNNDLNQYGAFDNNYYIRPFDDVFKIQAVYVANGNTNVANLALSQWQPLFGQDQNSRNSPITYAANTLTPTGNVLRNNAFTSDNNGWSTWSPYGNGRSDWDNSNRLDGGTMRISFANASNQSNSYVLATAAIGAVTKGKTYQFEFDAVATGSKRVEAFIRQLSGSYSDLAPRFNVLMSANRQHYTTAFTATADEANAIIVLQLYEDGQTAWFDNIKLQEATATPNNPDDFIRLFYNGTNQNTSVNLSGDWRDAKNQAYSGTVTLAPFTSLLLLKVVGNPPPVTPPTVVLRDPENPANAVNGLDYSYYEGSWNNVPDFNALSPVRSGNVGTPDLSVSSRSEQYAIQFKGYINVPADGTYTFYTNSDDGSKLYIGNTEVVNNDGGHPMVEKSGTIGLKAGTHALTIPFFQGAGGQGMVVSYAGPTSGKQVIPASAYYRVPSSGNPPPVTPPTVVLRDPENPANAVNGLDYSYYEGSWNNVPDFNALSPVRSGNVGTPDLSVSSRSEQYAIQFKGYINVPADGTYTFYTNSDDGSKLYIGNTEVVNNDGGHPMVEKSGTIGLKAGTHALTIPFFQGAGGQGMVVSYAGPTSGKQVIPASAYYRVPSSGGNSGTGTGLRAEYFNNANVTPPILLTRTDATVNFDWGTNSPAPGTINADNFSVRWTGQVEAPVSGNYYFSTSTDDGVRLWVNGVQLINDWNGHPPVTNNGASVAMNAGQKYTIRMEYFDGAIGAVARLMWAYPGQGQQIIPQNRLYPSTLASARTAATVPDFVNTDLTVQVYPIPAHDEIRLSYYSETAGEANVQLVNTAAQAVRQVVHQTVPGENIITIPVRELARGFYVLSLTQNNRRISRKVILSE